MLIALPRSVATTASYLQPLARSDVGASLAAAVAVNFGMEERFRSPQLHQAAVTRHVARNAVRYELRIVRIKTQDSGYCVKQSRIYKCQ
jgi:hypothetical protein